jgi:hypothetical protein
MGFPDEARAAAAHHQPTRQQFAGIEGWSQVTDFGEVIAHYLQLVGALHEAKYVDVIELLEDVHLIDDIFAYTVEALVTSSGTAIGPTWARPSAPR